MNSKFLLLALTVAAFSSCSTAYKSGQTPDDVYYSPIRVVEENKKEERKQDEVRSTQPTQEDRTIRWGIRDRRWRDIDDYDYSYNRSPYGYCHCSCNNAGYYYNPYYAPFPVYNPKITPAAINSTPRMINLGSYKGYNTAVNSNPKGGSGANWAKPQRQYNNSNNRSGFGNIVREIFTPSGSYNNSNNNSSSSNNNTRTYTPPANTNSSSGNNSSSGSSNTSGSSVPRPPRGGK